MEFVIFQNVNIYKDFLQPIGPERGEVFCIIFLCIWFVMCLYLHNTSELFIPLWLIFMKIIDEYMEFCCFFMRKILDSSFVRRYHCFVWNFKLVILLKETLLQTWKEQKWHSKSFSCQKQNPVSCNGTKWPISFLRRCNFHPLPAVLCDMKNISKILNVL